MERGVQSDGCERAGGRRGEGEKGVKEEMVFFFWLASGSLHADVRAGKWKKERKTKMKSKHAKGERIISLTLLRHLKLPSPNSLSRPAKRWKKTKKNSGMTALCASTFGLIRTIYFRLRYGWVETEVGVWRQIASIYSSKLKVLSRAVRAYFHFPLH